MSITDELRKFASLCPGGMGGDALRHIADRIDAAHRSALEKLAAQVDDDEDGWVRLPVDADGVPIHVGDTLKATYQLEGLQCGHVVCVQLRDDGWYVMLDAEHREFGFFRPNELHCTPTVEDVLDELFGKANLPDGTQTRAEIIAEYAAKLRLAGDE